MDILLTTVQHYNDRPSGSARVAHDEALYLAQRGHTVYLLASAADRPYNESEQFEGVTLLRYDRPSLGAADPRRVFANQVAAKRVLRRCVKRAIDVIHGHAQLSYLAACDLVGA